MKITKKFKGMLSFALTAMLTLGTVNVNAETTDSKNPVLPEEGKKGSITIHKYGMHSLKGAGNNATGLEDPSQVPEGAVPLKGISFTVQEVVVKENGDITVSNSTDKYELVEGKETITVTTDKNGKAETGEIPQGIYLVKELRNTSVTTEVADFIVNVPMTNPTGDGWIYDVHVYPKNVVRGEASIDKDVTESGNDHDTANIGDEITWIIKPSIPKDVYHSKKYEVTDILDSKLNYTGNLEVYYYELNGDKVAIDNSYYTVAQPTVTDDNKNPNNVIGDNQEIKVTFTAEGREFLGGLYEKGIDDIRITFNTIINKTANSGEPIYNNAILDYQNSFSTEDKPSDPVEVPEDQRPEVHTGGIKLLKVDANDASPLKGAEFRIYATKEDALAGTNPLNNPLTGKVWVETSGTDGIVIFKGLSYGLIGDAYNSNDAVGEYWIVETKSPTYRDENGEEKHYNLLKEPLRVTVHAESHKDKYAITVRNSKFSLPVTGGVGTVIFTLGGLAIMGAAAFLYMRTTRRA